MQDLSLTKGGALVGTMGMAGGSSEAKMQCFTHPCPGGAGVEWKTSVGKGGGAGEDLKWTSARLSEALCGVSQEVSLCNTCDLCSQPAK